MFADYEPLFSPRPFRFASRELLTKVWHAEIDVVARLLAEYPNVRNLLDAPEATVPERTACFVLLAHCKIIETIDETFVARYEESPSLAEVESTTLKRTYHLVAADAPAWVQEMLQLVGQLPAHISTSLPESLRAGRLNPDYVEQMLELQSAKNALSDVEQIQMLFEQVLDEQLRRLKSRWSTGAAQVRRPNKRKGWQQRLKLYDVIRKILRDKPSLQGIEFCAALDSHHAKPLFDWANSGQWREGLTWKEAWRSADLRRKIRRVRQEALKAR
jgi:hypothetical protein